MARNADHAREDAEKAVDQLFKQFGEKDFASPPEAANVFVDDYAMSLIDLLAKGPCKAAME